MMSRKKSKSSRKSVTKQAEALGGDDEDDIAALFPPVEGDHNMERPSSNDSNSDLDRRPARVDRYPA